MTGTGFVLLNNNRLGKKYFSTVRPQVKHLFCLEKGNLAGNIDFLLPFVLPKGYQKEKTEKHMSWRLIWIMSTVNIHGRYTTTSRVLGKNILTRTCESNTAAK